MDDKHGMEWAQRIHRPWNWYCPLEYSTSPPFTSEHGLLEHMSSTHSRDLPHSEIVLLCSRSKLPKLLGGDVCPFCGEPPSTAEYTKHQYHASAPRSMAEGLRLVAGSDPVRSRSSSPTGRPPFGDITTASDQDAKDPELLRKRMSQHVADHLESVALWSLRWHGDNSSTSSGVSEKTARETNLQSEDDETEVEVAEMYQTEVPDCPHFDWSMVPSLGYNDTLPEESTPWTKDTPFMETSDTLGDETKIEVDITDEAEAPVSSSAFEMSMTPSRGYDKSLLVEDIQVSR